MRNKNRQATLVAQTFAKDNFSYDEIETLVGAAMLTIPSTVRMVKLDTSTDAQNAGVKLPSSVNLPVGTRIIVKNPASVNNEAVTVGSADTHWIMDGDSDTRKELDYGYVYTFTLIDSTTARWETEVTFDADAIIPAP